MGKTITEKDVPIGGRSRRDEIFRARPERNVPAVVAQFGALADVSAGRIRSRFRADDIDRRRAGLVEYAVAVRVAIAHDDLPGHRAWRQEVRGVRAERDESAVGAQHGLRAVAVARRPVGRLAHPREHVAAEIERPDVADSRSIRAQPGVAGLERDVVSICAQRRMLAPADQVLRGACVAIADEDCGSGRAAQVRRVGREDDVAAVGADAVPGQLARSVRLLIAPRRRRRDVLDQSVPSHRRRRRRLRRDAVAARDEDGARGQREQRRGNRTMGQTSRSGQTHRRLLVVVEIRSR